MAKAQTLKSLLSALCVLLTPAKKSGATGLYTRYTLNTNELQKIKYIFFFDRGF